MLPLVGNTELARVGLLLLCLCLRPLCGVHLIPASRLGCYVGNLGKRCEITLAKQSIQRR